MWHRHAIFAFLIVIINHSISARADESPLRCYIAKNNYLVCEVLERDLIVYDVDYSDFGGKTCSSSKKVARNSAAAAYFLEFFGRPFGLGSFLTFPIGECVVHKFKVITNRGSWIWTQNAE